MAEVIENYIEIDGVKLWAACQGDGVLPVVLCHGGPGAYDTLGPIADMIDDLSTVYRYDQRGGGRSARVGPYTVGRFVADLEAIRLHYGVERWVVGGHSAGANLALRYAMAYPKRVTGLIYLNGTGLQREWIDEKGGPHDWGEYHRACDAKLSEKQRGQLRAATDSMARQAILSDTDYFDPGKVLHKQVYDPLMVNMEVNRALGHFADSTHVPNTSELVMPALVVHGEADPRPLYPVRHLADTLQNARLHLIEEMGHYPYLEAVERVRGLLREFIAGLSNN